MDIHVKDEDVSKFSEFPPIFKNTEIKMTDIGEHMQECSRSITRKTGVKRSLISSMKGKGIIILTPLLKWYLENGLVVILTTDLIDVIISISTPSSVRLQGKMLFKENSSFWQSDDVQL